jgi:hypothetical protein
MGVYIGYGVRGSQSSLSTLLYLIVFLSICAKIEKNVKFDLLLTMIH